MDYLALAVAANLTTAITIFLLTKGNIRVGAYTGFFGQCLWLTYIYLTSAWAFLPGDIIIFGMYCKKIYQWKISQYKSRNKVPEYLSGKGKTEILKQDVEVL